MDNKDNETPKNPKKDFEKMVELFFEKNKNPIVKQNNYAHAHSAAPAICKFLPMMDAGLAAAAQIYKVE